MIETTVMNPWIQAVHGQYIDVDGAYGAQCWDLAAHWSKWIGKPVINTGGAGRWPGWAGNMVDAFPQSPEIAAAYELIGPNQKGEQGDIVVWGDSYWYYPATHVAVLIADKGGMLTCMSQNSTPSRADNPYPGASSGPTTIQSLPRQGLIGFIRPRVGGIDFQSSTPSEEDDMFTDQDRADLKLALEKANRAAGVADAIEGNDIRARVIAIDERTADQSEKLADISWDENTQTSLRQEVAHIKVAVTAILQALTKEV